MKRQAKKMVVGLLMGLTLMNLAPSWVAAEDLPAAANPAVTADDRLSPQPGQAPEDGQVITAADDLWESQFTTEMGGGLEIIKYHGSDLNPTVPAEISGFPVLKIGDQAFDQSPIRTLTLPESVFAIGDNAFRGCRDLTRINLPAGLTSIGKFAFAYCTSLTAISLPPGITGIEDYSFYWCSSLSQLDLSENITRIEKGAFSRCRSLAHLTLPARVARIGHSAFYGCSELRSLTLSEGLIQIEDWAFAGCGITAMILPASLVSIGDFACDDCSSLKTIQFNSPDTLIGDMIPSTTIPETTTIIGYPASTAQAYAQEYGNRFQLIGETAILESIAITTLPTRLRYTVGEALDLSGLVVTGTYRDGSTVVENISPDNVSGFDSSQAARDQLITITVNDKTASYLVQIDADVDDIDCFYRTHVQNQGWQDWVENGETSGTSGQGLRLEGIQIKMHPGPHDLEMGYCVHLENSGWQEAVAAGQIAGTVGQGLRLEAIKINLTGTDAQQFDLYYQVHVQDSGWQDWVKNGAIAGSQGLGKRLEAINIKLVPKTQ